MNASVLEVTDFSDTVVNGNINVTEDGTLYTSVPHDGGWKVYVDGKETKVTPLKNAMVCIPVSAGTHSIEMKYSPPGFIAGLGISVVSIFVLIFWSFAEKSFRKKKATENTSGDTNTIKENEQLK